MYGVLTNEGVTKALRVILKGLNIEPITVHGLRHTHTSILLYSAISELYVSERLGHANPKITTETYSHILKELREKDEQLSKDLLASMRIS